MESLIEKQSKIVANVFAQSSGTDREKKKAKKLSGLRVMGNTDSTPATAPHAHSHHGHPASVQHHHATNGGSSINGHIAVQTTANSNSNGSSSAVYAGSHTVHQVVDTRGAPIGSDYVDICSAFEAMSKEDMEKRFLEIVVSQNIILNWQTWLLYCMHGTS